MKFDDILLTIGEFGPFQIRIFLLISFAAIPTALHHLSQVFLAGQSDHWCAVPELDSINCTDGGIIDDRLCQEAKRNATIPCTKSDCTEFAKCDRYDISELYFSPGDIQDVNSTSSIACDAGWVYDRSMYHSSIISEFDLVCDRKTLPRIAQSIYFAGVLIGSVLFGSMADWIGRYLTFFICVLMEVVLGVAVAFSPDFITYTVFRFFLSMCNMGLFLMAFVIVTEIAGPSKRVIAGVAIEFYFASGYMLLALAAYFVRDWRTLQLVLTIPVALFAFLIPILTESPRWLISRGKYGKAETILRKVADVNQKRLPIPLFEEVEVNKHLEILRTERQPSVLDLYKTPNLRAKTLNLMWNWCVNSLVYYGLSLSTSNLGGDQYVAFFISGAVEVPAYLYSLIAIELFGRKINLAGTMIIGGFACFATIFIPLGVWRTTVAMIGKFCIAASFAITYVFAAELYPTPVRSAGMGISSMSARIGGILAPLILVLGDYWKPLPLIIFGACSISAGLLALILPETKGKALPETLQEGELFGKRHQTTTNGNEEKQDGAFNTDINGDTKRASLDGTDNPTFEDAHL
ncbi:organic cation transporter protein-like [Amphiura filiformis]|uniref:organic cation transporter protein-like n=1 Tax=Amphiura filiformis TaxID=82378 RepID=UPI003B225726